MSDDAVLVTNDVDKRSLYLICGFINISAELHYLKIPMDVLKICAAFYLQNEYFSCFAHSYQLKSYSICRTITKTTRAEDCAFGNVPVDSTFQSIHRWTFEILDKRTGMSFGITDYDDMMVHRDCFGYHGNHNYCVLALKSGRKMRRGQIGNYDIQMDDGDKVMMELNLKSKELLFYVNGKSMGAAFNDIACGVNIKYKMAVVFGRPKSSVCLLDYVMARAL